MVTRSKTSRAARARRDAKARTDNRPWFDRATEGGFLSLDPGTYTLIISGVPEERVNDYGNPVLDIPTQKGILSTGSYSIMRPLARIYKSRGAEALIGARLTFTVTGKAQAKRYENVQVQVH